MAVMRVQIRFSTRDSIRIAPSWSRRGFAEPGAHSVLTVPANPAAVRFRENFSKRALAFLLPGLRFAIE
jgi:hypothetical protein